MVNDYYEINNLNKDESWRLFRIIGEFVTGFDRLESIEPAVTIFGSARVKQDDPMYLQAEDIAFKLGQNGFNIITGGGPGVMEAANKGAVKAGVSSVGISITLPGEPNNEYATKSLLFDHFFTRKVMLVKYATAFVIMPGGLGTMDELTELLTLMQTEKIRPFPVILFGSAFWEGLLKWLRDVVHPLGYISEGDFDLLRITDNTDEILRIINKWRECHECVGNRAL